MIKLDPQDNSGYSVHHKVLKCNHICKVSFTMYGNILPHSRDYDWNYSVSKLFSLSQGAISSEGSHGGPEGMSEPVWGKEGICFKRDEEPELQGIAG